MPIKINSLDYRQNKNNVKIRITTKGANGKNLEFEWNEDKLGVRQQGEEEYTYSPPLTGKNLEFNWDDNKLGVRQEGEYNYIYSSSLKGDKGDTPAITIGSVETGSPDSSASITDTGEDGNSVFNFSIPQGKKGEKGDKGDKGDTGESIDFQWDNTKLGIKKESDNNYSFVDLKGERGEDGKDSDVTKEEMLENNRLLSNAMLSILAPDSTFYADLLKQVYIDKDSE